MNEEILQKIKEDLLKRKAQVEAEEGGIGKADAHEHAERASFPEYGDESDENAQEVSQYTTDLEAERVLKGTLKDINGALKAIEKGTYGICKYCGKEIDAKRLLVRPFSSDCVACKTKLQAGD